ncbi:hypothetical protein [Tamlana flava]|uniref:hypothetical protein n=1 Tax=Tamlana flava TaxID=3158572 RepID=UPI00351B6E2D
MKIERHLIHTAIILGLMVSSTFAQNDGKPGYFFELHLPFQESFGRFEDASSLRAINDTTSLYKKRYAPGYKSNKGIEVVVGYYKNRLKLQTTINYATKDIALSESLASSFDGPRFLLVDMLTFKVSALFPWKSTNYTPFGLYYGFFISSAIPVSYDMNAETKSNFGIEDFNPSTQFNWGFDLNINLRFTNSPWYATGGFSATGPGAVGQIGKITLEPDSNYEIERDKFKMYTLNIFLGIGILLD